MWRSFNNNHKCQTVDGARNKVKGSPKSWGHIVLSKKGSFTYWGFAASNLTPTVLWYFIVTDWETWNTLLYVLLYEVEFTVPWCLISFLGQWTLYVTHVAHTFVNLLDHNNKSFKCIYMLWKDSCNKCSDFVSVSFCVYHFFRCAVVQ